MNEDDDVAKQTYACSSMSVIGSPFQRLLLVHEEQLPVLLNFLFKSQSKNTTIPHNVIHVRLDKHSVVVLFLFTHKYLY